MAEFDPSLNPDIRRRVDSWSREQSHRSMAAAEASGRSEAEDPDLNPDLPAREHHALPPAAATPTTRTNAASTNALAASSRAVTVAV